MRKDSGNGFHHTELGVLPVDWKIRSVRELQLDISDGNYSSKYPRADEFKSIGVPFIRANNIKGLTITDDDMRFISEKKHSEITKGHLKDGDVLITNRGDIGNLALVPARHIGSNINAQIVRINTSGSEVSNRYFAYYLQKDEVKKLLDDLSSGSALKQLPVNRLTTLKVIIPSPQEQTAIANALSDVDALISELEKLIAKKQAIKTATMQQLLTGRTRLPQFALRDNGTPKGTKPSELGEIPEDWEVYGLGQLIKGTQLGGNYKNSEQETGQPLIKMGNLGRGYIKLDKLEFVLGKVKDVDRLEFGDLLFNTRNTLDLVGKVSVWRNELPVAFFNSNLMRITFDPALIGSNFYMNAVMNSDGFVNALSDIAIGTTSVAAIYSRDLFKLKVSLPSKQEQTAIATILSDMDAEIQALEQRLGKTRQIKQGMMQELLTGKTRLIQGEAHD